MIKTLFRVELHGWWHDETPWLVDDGAIDAAERKLVALYPANQGFTVYRMTRVDITRPGEDNGPVEA